VNEVFGTDPDQPQRTGWSTVDAQGNTSFFSDWPASPDDAACPAGVCEPPVPPAMVSVDLDLEERDMLVRGLDDWGGPANGSDALAVAMGFESSPI
jgi:hypothetical protein